MDILIIMGSKSDIDYGREVVKILKEFGVDYKIEVSSAHRTPKRTIELVRDAEEKGCKVIISIAGAAAHLGGVIAAHTLLPVIAIPVDSSPLNGIDALLSSVMMPPGVPVGCMAIGKMGAKNGAIFAIEILSIYNESLKEKLKNYRKEMAEGVLNSSKVVKEELE